MKRIFLLIAAVILIAAILASCTGQTSKSPVSLDADHIKLVTAQDSLLSSYLYVIADEDAIAELVGMYNSLTYEPLADGEEAPDLLLDRLYMLSYHDQPMIEGVISEEIAWIGISPKGYVMLDDGENRFQNICRLTVDFDEEKLRAILAQFNDQPVITDLQTETVHNESSQEGKNEENQKNAPGDPHDPLRDRCGSHAADRSRKVHYRELHHLRRDPDHLCGDPAGALSQGAQGGG